MIQAPRLHLYLDAVARAGSIRKAAEKLRVASTALNRRILDFEKEIGSPLFERLPRGVRLTAAGEILIAAIRRGMSDLASAGSQIEQLRGLVRGTVRIACAESAANDLIPETIARYQERYPGVQFHLLVGTTPQLLAALMADEADLLLAHDPPSSDLLNVIETVKQPLCAMMRPGHALAGRKSLRLADCQPYSVALGAETFGSRRLINTVLVKSRLALKVAMETSAVQPQKVFARDTDAICFQYQIGTLRDVRYGELVAIPLTDPDLCKGRLVLGSRAGRILPIPAASFVETLKAAFSRLSEASPGAGKPRRARAK
jgi:DNA-binding transcriptional LysR family regulator